MHKYVHLGILWHIYVKYSIFEQYMHKICIKYAQNMCHFNIFIGFAHQLFEQKYQFYT